MTSEETLRFDIQKREQSVKDLPKSLIKKFVIIENRDSRGRVAFHIAFKKGKSSLPDTTVVPKDLRVYSSLIEAEIAIFNIIEDYLEKGTESDFSFIQEETKFKKIIKFLKHLTASILDK